MISSRASKSANKMKPDADGDPWPRRRIHLSAGCVREGWFCISREMVPSRASGPDSSVHARLRGLVTGMMMVCCKTKVVFGGSRIQKSKLVSESRRRACVMVIFFLPSAAIVLQLC